MDQTTRKPLSPQSAPDLSRFEWDDPLRLESQLDEDERMLRDAARDFAQSVLQPRVIDAFREESDAPELFAQMMAAWQAYVLRHGIDEEADLAPRVLPPAANHKASSAEGDAP